MTDTGTDPAHRDRSGTDPIIDRSLRAGTDRDRSKQDHPSRAGARTRARKTVPPRTSQALQGPIGTDIDPYNPLYALRCTRPQGVQLANRSLRSLPNHHHQQPPQAHAQHVQLHNVTASSGVDMTLEAFSPLITYVLAHRCPTCKAKPWNECNAPRKIAKANRYPPGSIKPYNRQHITRIKLGNAHYLRDVGNAPWPEERRPGKCYSTIPTRRRKLRRIT